MQEKLQKLDTAITELNKVLEVSAKELVDYTEKAYKIGETLPWTGKDVIRATEFARAGFNLRIFVNVLSSSFAY